MIMVKKVMSLIVFFLIFITACFLGYLLYKKYTKNDDISSVTYRPFNKENPGDGYPVFSICLYSSYGMIFKQNKNILGIKGWKGGNLYRKMLLGQENVKNRLRVIDFDDVAVDFLDSVFLRFHVLTKQGKLIDVKWKQSRNQKEINTFLYTYQDPNQICVTRNRPFVRHSILNYERLKLDANRLYNITADLHVYIHKPHELTRILHKPIVSFSLNDFKEMIEGPTSNNNYHFNVNQVEVIRNRPDGTLTCNKTLNDDDSQYRQVIVQSIGCIPSYWKRFFLFSSKLKIQGLPDCVNRDDYLRINKLFLPDLNVINATKLYLQPCDRMKSIISTTKSSTSERRTLLLQFDYICEEYKVPQNNLMFTSL